MEINQLKLSELSPAALEHINTLRFDRFIEKHEGPEEWSSILKFYAPEFMTISGYDVLLPIEYENHPNVTVLRCITSADGNTLTIFLLDRTYAVDPKDEMFYSGRLAVCEKVKGTEYFLASVYHEWFIIDTATY